MRACAWQAASGGALAGETRSRVPENDWARGLHLCAAGDVANLSRAARPARMRRRQRTMRRRGAVRRGGEAPASFHGRHGAWGQQQVARVASSPPCASPGQLLDGETAATAGSNGGARVRVPAAAWVDGVAARVQIRGPRGWRRLK
jgi:hypothetical protein